jgi:hypothetical protein
MRRALLFAVVLALPLAGCGRKVMERKDWEASLYGATPDQVRSRVGSPDKVNANPGDMHAWEYNGRTVDPKTGKTDKTAVLWFDQGMVKDFGYAPGP